MRLRNVELVKMYEQVLVLEYSEGFLKQQIKRLLPQAGRGVSPESIKRYLQRFDQLKTHQGSRKNLIDKVNLALQQGKLPKNKRTGAFIAPMVDLDPEQAEAMKNNPNLSDQERKTLSDYYKELQRIQKLQNNPIEVTFYSWKDLEAIVDQFPDPYERAALKSAGVEGAAKLIYDKNNLEIYFGATKNECFILKNVIIKRMKELGEPNPEYSFCISKDPTQGANYFMRYRSGSMGYDTKKSVYFVLDTDRKYEDKLHFIVIHVAENEREGGKKYMVTSSRNDGDIWMTWDQITNLQPKLKGLENLFEFVPLSDDEQIEIMIDEKGSPDDFKTYTSFRVKKAFIEAGKKIYSEDYKDLDDFLQNIYIKQRLLESTNEKDPERALKKILSPFANSTSEQYKIKMQNAIDESNKREVSDDEFIDLITQDEVLRQSKGSTFNLYRKGVGLNLDRVMQSLPD
jgi:hypothetical protein